MFLGQPAILALHGFKTVMGGHDLSPHRQIGFDLSKDFWYLASFFFFDPWRCIVKTLLVLFVIAQAVPGGAPPGQPQAPQAQVQTQQEVAPQSAVSPVQAPVQTQQPAQASPPVHPNPAETQGMWTTLIFFAVMILVFWLLIIRPQQKQRKKQEQFLQSLKVGDKVVTSSGVIGKIVSISGNIVTLEIAKDVRARVLKPYVVSLFAEEGEQQKQS